MQSKEKLSSFNYYTLTGYLHDFRKPDSENYIESLTFEKIFHIIEFDRRFRNILLYALETIEHRLKTKIAFYHARTYGADAYLYAINFRDHKKHTKFLDFFRRAANREPKPPFVKHHEAKYGGVFPIWVGVELFTMGMLYHFYQNLPGINQKAIARKYNTGSRQLESWIECVTYLRNMIAHYMRIYNFKTQKTPIRCNKNHEYKDTNHFVFDIVYVMKFMFGDAEAWNNVVVANIRNLFDEYQKDIDPSCIGFDVTWEDYLKIATNV